LFQPFKTRLMIDNIDFHEDSDNVMK